MMVVQGYDVLLRFRFSGWSDKEKLRGDEDCFEHQAQGRGIIEFIVAGEIVDVEKDVQFRIGGRTPIGIPGKGTSDLAGLLAEVGASPKRRFWTTVGAFPSGAATCSTT